MWFHNQWGASLLMNNGSEKGIWIGCLILQTAEHFQLFVGKAHAGCGDSCLSLFHFCQCCALQSPIHSSTKETFDMTLLRFEQL